jgi:hypothetical protein
LLDLLEDVLQIKQFTDLARWTLPDLLIFSAMQFTF